MSYERGSNRYNAILTEADIPLIRQDTRTYKEIGRSFGISAVMVCFIKQRKKWKHVLDDGSVVPQT